MGTIINMLTSENNNVNNRFSSTHEFNTDNFISEVEKVYTKKCVPAKEQKKVVVSGNNLTNMRETVDALSIKTEDIINDILALIVK